MNNYGILVFLWENSSFLWERGVANGKSLNDTSYGTKLALTDVCFYKFLDQKIAGRNNNAWKGTLVCYQNEVCIQLSEWCDA